MDENYIEVAEALENAERNAGIHAASKKALPDKLLEPSEYKTLECIDCGDNLPEFRMQRGCVRCVICQGRLERGWKS